MRLYNAGLVAANMDRHGRSYTLLDTREREMLDSNPWHLESYHYVHKATAVRKMRQDKKKVFLDSGAFSAMTQGIEIDIKDYCAYVHHNSDIIDFPSVLDSIGDPKKTFHNQKKMESLGVNALPCWHYGEPDDVGKYYVDNYEYITLGGLVPISTQQMIYWLDHIFEKVICDEHGQPRCKVHGFGVTSLPIMLRYPWFSVDSSTWVQWGAMGFVLLPESGRQVNISARSGSRKTAGQHIDTVRPIERERLEEEIIATGADPERLREVTYARWAFNAWAFPEYLNRRLAGKPARFTRQQQGLF